MELAEHAQRSLLKLMALATSPGGADSVAVIAVGSAVDAGFVMAMQMVRFFMVLLLGPRLSRWLVQRLTSRSAA